MFMLISGQTCLLFQDTDYHLYILEYGSHLGALGAMIIGAEKSAYK